MLTSPSRAELEKMQKDSEYIDDNAFEIGLQAGLSPPHSQTDVLSPWKKVEPNESSLLRTG